MSDDDIDEGAAPADEAGIGYGRPPKQTRFKPGQSGNRGGRPRGARGLKKIVQEIAFETHVVTEDGRRTRRSTIELVAMALRRHAMSGNIRAIRAAHDYLQRFGIKEPDKRGGFLVVNEPPRTEEQKEEYFKRLAEQQRKYRERSTEPGVRER